MTELNTIKSIEKFKKRLVSEIPFSPNTYEAKIYLYSLDISDLIHIYDFWQQRLIQPIPRETVVSSKVRNSLLYIRNKTKIEKVLGRARQGDDINQYLSRSAHSATFDVEAFKNTKSFNSFRDQILICEEFYHLHLDEFPVRTDEMIIAYVTPEIFEVVQIAKHDLFEDDREAMTEFERYIDEFLSTRLPEGGCYIGGAGGGTQNLAGSSVQSTFNQIHARKILQHVELACGGIESYSKQLYRNLEGRNTQYVKPEWRMKQRELIIYEKKNKREFDARHLCYRFDQSHG